MRLIHAKTSIFRAIRSTDTQLSATYEEIPRRRLDDLEQDYRMPQVQGQELTVRNVQGRMQIRMVA